MLESLPKKIISDIYKISNYKRRQIARIDYVSFLIIQRLLVRDR